MRIWLKRCENKRVPILIIVGLSLLTLMWNVYPGEQEMVYEKMEVLNESINESRVNFERNVDDLERVKVLNYTIEKLRGIQNVEKILIRANDDTLKSIDELPDIGVPIELQYMLERNSLNNRFIPDNITTRGVFSMDDDVHLRPEEISLAFRVWRDNRETIVGLLARVHVWNERRKEYVYVNEHETYSMVLTGASFLHVKYLSTYTNQMNRVIRDIVDKNTNCEDIAMNFLVAHISRKPPIQVTDRKRFPCPYCTHNIWRKRDNRNQRDACINHFYKIYGYMPLLENDIKITYFKDF